MRLQRLMNSLPGRVARKFAEDQAPKQAVLIAWNALFALFPILIFSASILGLFLSHAGFKEQEFYIDVSFLIPDPSTRAPLLEALQSAKQKTGIFLVIGLAGLLWAGANLFGTMEDSFAVIYHTKSRGLVKQKLVAFAMMVLFTGLAGLIVLSSSLLPLLNQLPYTPGLLTNTAVAFGLQVVVGIVAGLVLFSAIYYVVPNRRQRFGQVVPGAVIAAVLFEILTQVFPLYLSLNRGLGTYGQGFALLFVLLTFFYFLGLVVMIGVEVNSVLYPIPVEQPNPAAALAPLATEVDLSPPGHGEEKDSRRRGRLPALLGLAAASILGLLVGRRTGRNR